jgi:hypothetical protein
MLKISQYIKALVIFVFIDVKILRVKKPGDVKWIES